MGSRLKANAPAIVLFLLSPAVGELLSGSAPPVEFFNPFGFVVMVCLYGSGALLIRDAVRRRGKGYPSLLCLGAAYGIFEEGVVCKSFFDPQWPDLGPLGSYGRWLGTNWVWAVWLTLYHTVVSIAVPILLVEVGFPRRRGDPWLGRRWRFTLFSLLALEAVLGYFGLTPYRPPWANYMLTWAVVFGLITLAPRLPGRVGLVSTSARGRAFWLWLVGCCWTVASFVTFAFLPGTGIPVISTLAIGVAVSAAVAWLVVLLSGNLAAWSDRGRFLLGAGVLSFFVLVAPLQELDKQRTDNPSGMALVGLIALALLLWQGRRVWRGSGGARKTPS